MRRGISGGQKKRANTGEMMVGPAKAVFMDEISTGLDSSTAYRIVKCLSQSVHVMESTMVVSLLQPAPETFELFDDLILLSEGQIIYQGPRDLVTDFFESMGFKCPERKAVADFLQEVTSRKDQQQYWCDRSVPYCYVSVKAFVEGFAKFHAGEKLDQELGVPFEKGESHPAALVMQKYALSNWEVFQACFTREKLMMKRTKVVYIFRIVQVWRYQSNIDL
jgi:ABC-type multidrug transport system ATPase subunit